jgi:hypothetical protein
MITAAGLELAFNATFAQLMQNGNFIGRGFYVHFYSGFPFNESSRVILPTKEPIETQPQPLTFDNNQSFVTSGLSPNKRIVQALNSINLLYKATQTTSFRYLSLQASDDIFNFDAIWYIDLGTSLTLTVDEEFEIPSFEITLELNADVI